MKRYKNYKNHRIQIFYKKLKKKLNNYKLKIKKYKKTIMS